MVLMKEVHALDRRIFPS